MTKRDAIHRAQFAALWAVMGLFRILPPRAASQIGGFLLGAAASLFKAQNKRILKHLALAFPDKTDEERARIRSGMWRHLGMLLGEYPHLDKALDGDPAFEIEVEGAGHLEVAKTRTILFVSAHVGNWEILPIAAMRHGAPFHAVYRAPNNPYAAHLLEQYRSAGGRLPQGFPKSRAGMKLIAEALKSGRHVGMLIDQRHSSGHAIDFFGHPAETTPVTADLALKYATPIITAHVVRLGPCRFRVMVDPPLEPQGQTSLELTQTLYKRFEDWIAAAPEQWLWTHRRWGKKI